ncbi:hypothetical protein M405DRAFT_419505 [Rhizopogon salebrosus TDB-379]|nr:hypothetical protein M405DRAFT_419505 [Rhizopogon salebrosus TDB-379]
MKLSRQDSFCLQLLYKTETHNKNKFYDVYFDMEDIFHTYGALGGPDRQEYYTSRGEINIVLVLSEKPGIPPITDDTPGICPWFRILVIGKTGVGKSLLIHHAFGVENALPSHVLPGNAHMDTEFIPLHNNKLVLHDSKGFEPEEDNINIVQQFIERRRKMPDLRDQLHAVWLCLDIPRTGGRLLETGTEDFLKLRHDEKLGSVPIIIVVTKYDELIDEVEYELGPSVNELSDDAIKELIKERGETKLQEICIGPLERLAGSDIPHAAVSIKDGYKESLIRLIQMTKEHVYKHIAGNASLITVAQRVDLGLKIKASIEVGKRQYRNAFASYIPSNSRTAQAYLHALHTDIVAVWNFNDPHCYLSSRDFRTLMVNMVDKLDVGPPATSNPGNAIKVGLSMMGGILTARAGPIARFISYIVDLTIILQTLYLVSGLDKQLSIRVIKLTVAAYHRSSVSGDVHARVQGYVRKLTILDRADRDILDKVVELVNLYSIDTREISFLQQQIPAVGLTDGPSGEIW